MERSLDDDDWTRMKLPTSLGADGHQGSDLAAGKKPRLISRGMKTRKQAERVGKSLTGKQGDYTSWECERERYEMWDGTQNVGHEDRRETMTGPFNCDLVNASKGYGFLSSISRTLKTHEIITAHKLWSKLDTILRKLHS